MNKIKSIIIALLVFASNFIVAQEVKTKKFHIETPRFTESEISYLVDELGYYQNLHGWQIIPHFYNGKGLNDFDNTYYYSCFSAKTGFFRVKYDNGTPKCFKYIGLFKHSESIKDERDFSSIDHYRYISKGVYDSDGICSYEMNWNTEGYRSGLPIGVDKKEGMLSLRDSRGHQRVAKVLNSIGVPQLVFDADMSGEYDFDGDGYEHRIEERVYGFFDSTSCCAVQRFVPENHGQKVCKGYSFILNGSKLYLFESADELDAFLEFDCHSAKEMQSAYTLKGSKYSKYWEAPFGSNWWFMRAIESMLNFGYSEFTSVGISAKNTYSSFTEAEAALLKDVNNIPKSCWKTSFGTKVVFSPVGIDDLKFKYDDYTVYEVSKKKQQGNAKIEYLTEEQYEKYKDRLEYDSAKQRHYVKKADNSRLYVPDQYEKLIEKTADEIKKDEELAEQQKTEYKKAENLFSVLTEAKMLQGLVSSLPKLDESLFE